jgi:LPXTG-motif cell wall-anchored protein
VLGETLPRTGSGTAVPMTLAGIALVALGSALRRWGSVRPARVVARHRRRR